jgi:hypothetical protein
MARMETGVVLRAVAIVFIVSTHIGWFSWPGTAHVLLALAGFNFARFQLSGERRQRLGRHLRSITRIVVPSVAVIAVAYATTSHYTLANVFLVNSFVGPGEWNDLARFWFVERIVYLLAGAAALLTVPVFDRAQRRWPWGFPCALLGAGLVTRFLAEDPGRPDGPLLWLFALGWGAAVSRSVRERAVLTAAALFAAPGYFESEYRDATILVGILLLVWVPALWVPRALQRPIGLVASASLYIYLTHWLVYPLLDQTSKELAVAASLVVGLGSWAVATRLMTGIEGYVSSSLSARRVANSRAG